MYNLCVVKVYKDGERIEYHTDTFMENGGELANEDGTAVFSVTYGATMELWTRTGRYTGSARAATLVHGSAFCWDAGAPGSDDWSCEHRVIPPTPPPPPGAERIAFVFRAMKPKCGLVYRTHRYPYYAVTK